MSITRIGQWLIFPAVTRHHHACLMGAISGLITELCAIRWYKWHPTWPNVSFTGDHFFCFHGKVAAVGWAQVPGGPGLQPAARDWAAACRALACSWLEHLGALVKKAKVVVFLKGTLEQPQCGFSNALLQILRLLSLQCAGWAPAPSRHWRLLQPAHHPAGVPPRRVRGGLWHSPADAPDRGPDGRTEKAGHPLRPLRWKTRLKVREGGPGEEPLMSESHLQRSLTHSAPHSSADCLHWFLQFVSRWVILACLVFGKEYPITNKIVTTAQS